MEIKTKFKIGSEAWIIRNNKVIYRKIESIRIDIDESGIHIKNKIIPERDEGIRLIFNDNELFVSKESLFESLFESL